MKGRGRVLSSLAANLICREVDACTMLETPEATYLTHTLSIQRFLNQKRRCFVIFVLYIHLVGVSD